MRWLVLLAVLAAGCSSSKPVPRRAPNVAAAVKTSQAKEAAHAEAHEGSGGAKLVATVDDTAVVALSGQGFDALPREQRLLAWWLSQAARAGDAIAWDQGYRHNLAVARVVRGILTRPRVLPEELRERVRVYARRLYLNRGLHDAASERKLDAPFSFEELRSAALAAQAAGADLGLGGASLEPALRGLEGAIFDPKLDPIRTSRAPGEDSLRSSAVNLYSGVSLRDLNGFREQYAANSRLVKEGGRLVEEVYRAGLGSLRVQPGLHADRLAKAADALDKAAGLAAGEQRESLVRLSRWLRTGFADDLRASQAVAARTTPAVDAIIGFHMPQADPRGLKGLWLGLVGFRDAERSAQLERLAEALPYFEARAPWPEEFKRKDPRKPTVASLVLASAAGAARPEPFLGLQITPGQRGRAAGKAVLLPGLDDAAALARDVRATAELAPPELAAELVRCRGQLRWAAAALEEVVGHAAEHGVPPRGGPGPLAADAEHAATLEEARGELIAHHHLGDPRIVELGLLADPRCQQHWPHLAAVGWLQALATLPQGERIDGLELRAMQLQLWWFTQRRAVVVRKSGDRTVLAVPDAAAFHKAAGSLLSLLQTIQATGDAALLRG